MLCMCNIYYVHIVHIFINFRELAGTFIQILLYNIMCTEPGLPPVCKVYVLLRHACAARATRVWPMAIPLPAKLRVFVIFSVVVCEGYNHSTSTHGDIAVPLLIGGKLYNMG